MANYPVEMTGKRFGRLVCLTQSTKKTKAGSIYWLCQCDCGNQKECLPGNLRAGTTISCGCAAIEGSHKSKGLIHGHSSGKKENGARKRSPTYRSWMAMRARCNNPNNDFYPIYGGRGIQICTRWNDFKNFLTDMGERPQDQTIDRINPNGNYEPSNCRWATHEQQRFNRR